jgi:FkbM family methyltransferase
MARMTFGDLDLAVIDPHERDTNYIYEEIFKQRIYHHSKFRIPANATIMDVGANIGLYSIWAAREYNPAAIFTYEASPVTFRYLIDNVSRHIDKGNIEVRCVNRAVSSAPGLELILKQAPLVSGISTMLDATKVTWVRDLQDAGDLVSHKTISTTVSAEIAKNGSARIDILKIDVEGHFMEVLAGISEADFERIGNIVLEADYLDVLQLSEERICAFLGAKGYTTEARDLTVYAWR